MALYPIEICVFLIVEDCYKRYLMESIEALLVDAIHRAVTESRCHRLADAECFDFEGDGVFSETVCLVETACDELLDLVKAVAVSCADESK